MKLTFLGTSDAGQVPCYGCRCEACRLATTDAKRSRSACSIEVEGPEGKFIIDAGQVNLPERYPAGSLQAILLTHYHMDHVLGLFHLRWGVNTQLAVFGPKDEKGCDDLYKHPGILDFKAPLLPFQSFSLVGLRLTPIPLKHSKPCLGYLLEDGQRVIAYLTDTCGLSDEAGQYLRRHIPDIMIIDCTHPPTAIQPRNHNNWQCVQSIQQVVQPRLTYLTHISHEMDCWLINNRLPEGTLTAMDNMVL